MFKPNISQTTTGATPSSRDDQFITGLFGEGWSGKNMQEHLDYAERNPLPKETTSQAQYKFTDLPNPPADSPIAHLAYWVYSDVMISPQKSIAIMVAWALAAHFAGRKDNFLNNPPVLNITLLAINGTGKDTFNKALGKIHSSFHTTLEDHWPELRIFERNNATFGTKKMHEEDMGLLSGVRLISEAGLVKGSKAGDGASLLAAELQNLAQDAYMKRSYRGTADGNSQSFGACISLFSESTPETFLQGLEKSVATGQLARSLTVYTDCSDVGETKFYAYKPVPPHIKEIVRMLAAEALRGEKPFSEWGKDSVRRLSDEPVPLDMRRNFTPHDQAVRDLISKLEKEDTEMRRNNTENNADQNWAHQVRSPMLIFRLACLHARTRVTCAPTAPATVTVQDMEIAIAMLKECQRADRANGGNYDAPVTRLVEAMKNALTKSFQSGKMSNYYRDAYKEIKSQDEVKKKFDGRLFKAKCFAKGGRVYDEAGKLMTDKIARTRVEAYNYALAEGENLNYWRRADGDEYQLL